MPGQEVIDDGPVLRRVGRPVSAKGCMDGVGQLRFVQKRQLSDQEVLPDLGDVRLRVGV